MQKYRKLLISALLLAAVAAAAFLLIHRAQRPPEAARLLPEGDRLFYLNLRPVHLWELNKSKPLHLEGDYREFVEQTGIQFERDLDEVALSRRDTSDGRDVESAEVFAGRFDRERLKSYLQKISSQTETYRDQIIFSVLHDGHTVRICILDGATVAVTNMVSAEPMQGMIDRFRQPSGEPSLLHSYYHSVPLTSLAWMIDRIPANSNAPQLPGGLNFSFLENTVSVASLRYNGAVLFQADVFALTDADAKRVMDSANTFLVVYRTAAGLVRTKGTDADVKAVLESIRIEQKGNVAVFTATFSQKFLKKILSEAQPENLAGTTSSAPTK